MNKWQQLGATLALLGAAAGNAHDMPATPEPQAAEVVMKAFGWDFATAEVKVQTVAEGLHGG